MIERAEKIEEKAIRRDRLVSEDIFAEIDDQVFEMPKKEEKRPRFEEDQPADQPTEITEELPEPTEINENEL